MNALESLALMKAAADSAKGLPAPSPGKHAVDFVTTIRVVGTLTKGQDTEYTPTADIPLKQALALALHYAGCTREAAKDILVWAMTDVLAGKADAIGDCLEDVDKAMKHVQEVTESLPKKTRAGALTAKLVMLLVEMMQVA